VIVAGLDLSLTCSGVTVIRDGEVDLYQVRSPAPVNSDVLTVWERIRYSAIRVVRLVPADAVVVVEWASYASKFGQPDERNAHRWLVVGTLAQRGCRVLKASPKTRAKYAADDGNADKKRVLAAMRGRHPDLVIADDNVADSLALAAMGARHLGRPIDGIPSKQQTEVMRTLRWPKTEGATP
jgi:hypothetical protein